MDLMIDMQDGGFYNQLLYQDFQQHFILINTKR
jgi:hypothetical protein